ncbi:MAG TPA: biotin/lipoyl-binding protein [Phototrophicaceae bacterium]|nr:biotin/lipoyl-binding protein [Phototrophicaceae bacterium]
MICKQRTLYCLLASLILMLVSACSPTAPTGAQAQPPAAPTSTPIPTAPAVARPKYMVQRGDVQVTLEFSGRWQSRDQVALAFNTAGTVRQVEVRRNDTVKTGDLLADLKIDDLENQLASAELDLETATTNLQSGAEGSVNTVADAEVALANARLRLQDLKDTLPWPQLETSRLNLEAAEQDLVNAQRDYDDAISRSDQAASVAESAYTRLQDAKNSVRTAEASYFSSAQSFNSHKTSISEQENTVIKAELDLQRAQQGGGDPTKAQALRAAQMKIDQIKASIAQSSLYSPIDGVVLEVNIKPCARLKCGATIPSKLAICWPT